MVLYGQIRGLKIAAPLAFGGSDSFIPFEKIISPPNPPPKKKVYNKNITKK